MIVHRIFCCSWIYLLLSILLFIGVHKKINMMQQHMGNLYLMKFTRGLISSHSQNYINLHIFFHPCFEVLWVDLSVQARSLSQSQQEIKKDDNPISLRVLLDNILCDGISCQLMI